MTDMKPTAGFIELTDERGQSLLVQRDEIALVRDCDPTIAYMRSVLVLKCGETIALQTEFKNVLKRLQASGDEGDVKCLQ